MESSDWISLGALTVSFIALWLGWESRTYARKIDAREHDTEVQVKSLEVSLGALELVTYCHKKIEQIAGRQASEETRKAAHELFDILSEAEKTFSDAQAINESRGPDSLTKLAQLQGMIKLDKHSAAKAAEAGTKPQS